MRRLRLVHPVVWMVLGPVLIALVLAAAISAGSARSMTVEQIHSEVTP